MYDSELDWCQPAVMASYRYLTVTASYRYLTVTASYGDHSKPMTQGHCSMQASPGGSQLTVTASYRYLTVTASYRYFMI